MSAGSILEKSTELGYLAKYVSPSSLPPPPETSLDIWAYLASQILPGTLQFHLDGVPAKARNFKSFQILAKAARISDHTISNAKTPSKDIWQHQMSELTSYLEFREKFREDKLEYIDRFSKLKQRRTSLNEEIDKIDLEWGDLDIEAVRSQFETNNQFIDNLANRIESASQLRKDLSNRITKYTSNVEDMELKLNSLRQQTDDTLGHINMLKTVAKEGWSQLRDAVAQIETNIGDLNVRHSGQQAILEQYKYTMHVFEELIPILQNLMNIETGVIRHKDERTNLEISHLRSLKQKFTSLSRQVAKSSLEVERKKQQVKDLRENVSRLEQQLETENDDTTNFTSPDHENSLQQLDEQEIEQGEAQLIELRKQERDLNLLLKTQRKWLLGMIEAEKYGSKLLAENSRIKEWMNDYLELA